MKKYVLFFFALFFYLTSFSQESTENGIVLFPNTASTQVNLLLSESIETTDISVYDLAGRLIKKIPLNNSSFYTIDTSAIPQGMYLVAVTNALGIKTKKFIVDPNSTNGIGYWPSSPLEEDKRISLTVNNKVASTSLSPIDDAYLQGSTRFNTATMKVYTSYRSSYLKFDLSSISGKITAASLKFTVDADAGSGTIEVYKGDSTNWNEDNLSLSNIPGKSLNPIGTTNSTYGINKRVSIDLNVNELNNSLLSLVMTQPKGTNDFAFASKEHISKTPPELVIVYEDSKNNSNSSENDNSEGIQNTSNNSSSYGSSLIPVDDAFLQGSRGYNTSTLKVYTGYRSSYFKFDLSSIPRNFTNASLEFTIDSDSGSGMIEIYKGASTNWTEDDLSSSNKPKKGSAPIGTTTGTHKIGKRVSIDLDANKLDNSLLSLIMVQPEGTDDFAFASKEHTSKASPKLVISYEGNSNTGTKKPTEDEPFEFWIDFTNPNILFDMLRAIEAAQRAAVNDWMDQQEENFRREINHQLGTNYGDFGTAQKAYFKDYEKNQIRVNDAAGRIASDYREESVQFDNKQQEYTSKIYFIEEWKFFRSWCGGHGNPTNCQALTSIEIDGKKLGEVSDDSELLKLNNNVVKDFSEMEVQSAMNISISQGLLNSVNDGNLVSDMAEKHHSYYHSSRHTFQDQIFLMTAYLSQFYHRPPLALPPGTKKIPSFWNDETLLEIGKKKEPKLDLEQLVFQSNYIQERVDLQVCCPTSPEPPGALANRLTELKEKVIDEHIDDLNLKGSLSLEDIKPFIEKNTDPWDESKTGNYRGIPALAYTATRDIIVKGRILKNYRLANGDELAEGIYPRSALSSEGYKVLFYYSKDTNSWYSYNPSPSSANTDMDYLIDAFWDGAQFVGTYIIPVEDVIIFIDGKNFDGEDANRYLAGAGILLAVVPGGKLLQPIKIIVKGTPAWKVAVSSGGKLVNLSFKTVNGIVDFGSRSKLAQLIVKKSGEEAHHMIPWALRNNKVVQEASYAGFHMSSPINGRALQKFSSLTPNGIHANHPAYNAFVEREVQKWVSKNPNFTSEQAMSFLEGTLIPGLNELIELAKKSGLTLNEYFKTL